MVMTNGMPKLPAAAWPEVPKATVNCAWVQRGAAAALELVAVTAKMPVTSMAMVDPAARSDVILRMTTT